MEYTSPEEDLIPLAPEIVTKIRTTMEIVKSSPTLEEATHWAQLLDMELADDELIGRAVAIESDAMVWIQGRINAQGQFEVIPVTNAELLRTRHVVGTFAGTDVMEAQGTYQLIYRINQGEEGSYEISITAPAEASILNLQPSEYAPKSPEENIIHFLTLLRTIRHDRFREDLSELESLIESLAEPGVSFDADFLREIGVVATDLLSYDSVRESEEMTQAVLEVLASLINRGNFVVLEGDEIKFHSRERDSEGRVKVSISTIRYSGSILGVGTVSNYDYAPDDPDRPLFDELKQPAIVFDAEGSRHSMPLKFVTRFSQKRQVSESELCAEGRTRFLDAYPAESWASSK
jgi:hypothetical protein